MMRSCLGGPRTSARVAPAPSPRARRSQRKAATAAATCKESRARDLTLRPRRARRTRSASRKARRARKMAGVTTRTVNRSNCLMMVTKGSPMERTTIRMILRETAMVKTGTTAKRRRAAALNQTRPRRPRARRAVKAQKGQNLRKARKKTKNGLDLRAKSQRSLRNQRRPCLAIGNVIP